MTDYFRFRDVLDVARAYQSGDTATGDKLFKEHTLGDEHEDQCVHCGQDTRVSGYVNRIPADPTDDDPPFPSARIMCGSCVSEGDMEIDGERAMRMMEAIEEVMNNKEIKNVGLSTLRQAIVNVFAYENMEGLLELDSRS